MFVDAAAVVSGFPAVLVGVGLRDLARKGFYDGVEPTARAELLALISAIERAGRTWQARADAAAGNPETSRPEIGADSAMTAEQAAGVLNLSARRVRQLAPVLGGSRAGGRWVFDRTAVLAEWERRRER